ncbi:MAG: hypothetical protein IJG56_04010 [Clostridia bacterium]|nr:hypothetical protein [Clostridia bacterium]
MEERQKAPTPRWKGCIIIGFINIALVFLATALGVTLISTALAVFIVIGVLYSLDGVKEDWKAGFKASCFGCIVGFLLNGFAAFLYVSKILSGLIGAFSKFF